MGKWEWGCGGFLALFFLVAIGGIAFLGSGDEFPKANQNKAAVSGGYATATPSGRTVTLTGVSSSQKYPGGNFYTEGEVTNTSSEAIKFLQLVVRWSDKADVFITSEDGYAEYQTLLPGQTSPFKVLTAYNPAMVGGGYSVRAKTSFGGPIEVTSIGFRR